MGFNHFHLTSYSSTPKCYSPLEWGTKHACFLSRRTLKSCSLKRMDVYLPSKFGHEIHQCLQHLQELWEEYTREKRCWWVHTQRGGSFWSRFQHETPFRGTFARKSYLNLGTIRQNAQRSISSWRSGKAITSWPECREILIMTLQDTWKLLITIQPESIRRKS